MTDPSKTDSPQADSPQADSPQAHSSEARPRRLRWLRRLVLAIVVVLVAFELIYLVAGNAFLRSEWGRQQINRRPEKFTLAWDKASTWWPGRIELSAVAAEGHARRVDWNLNADQALLVMDLLPLLRKTFRVEALEAQGVTFASRRLEVPRQRPPPRLKSNKPWTLRFDDVAFEGVRSIRYNELEFLPDGEAGGEGGGEGRVAGAMVIALRRTVELQQTVLSWSGARLELHGEPWVESLNLDSRIRIAPWNPREHRGLASLAFLSGDLAAQGRVALPGVEEAGKSWSIGGRGELVLRAVAEDGQLTPETRATLGLEGFDLQLPKGDLSAAVEAVAGVENDLLVAGLNARDLSFTREDEGEPLVKARQARISVGSEDRSLATGLKEMAHRLRAMRNSPQGDEAARVATIDAQGVQLTGAGRLEGTLEELGGNLDLNALADRRIALSRVRGRGGELAWLPKGESSPRNEGAHPWSYDVTDVELVDLPKVSFGVFDLEPVSAFGAASIRFQPGREIELGGAYVREGNGRLIAAGRPVASRLVLDGRLDFGPFDLGSGGREAIAQLTTTTKVSGQVTSLGFFRYAFEAVPWLGLDGAGDLDAELRIEGGRLAVGSRLRVEASPVEADFLDYRVVGDAAVSAIVANDSRGPRADLFVNLEDFKMAGLSDPDRPYVEGRGFHLTATTADLDLRKPFEDLEAVIDLPDSSVPDLTVYNAYLPARANVGIDSGSGRVQAYFELSAADDSGWGRVDVRSSEVRMHLLGQELAGALRLKTRLETTELEKRTFSLDDSRLELTDVALTGSDRKTGEANWWARLELTDGDVSWSKPLTMDSQATLTMKDTGFLLSVFSERKRWLNWFQRLLDFEGVVGNGRVVLEPGSLRLDPVLISAEKLEIRTRLRFADGTKQGYLYVKSHGLAAGLELADGERDFKLIRAKQWYETRPAFP